MAKPIKETPVLRGNDAEKFITKMRNASKVLLPKEEVIRMQQSYIKIAKLMSESDGLIRI